MPAPALLAVISRVLLAAAPVAAAPPPAAAGHLDVGTVVDKVQRRYDGASDFRARFTQTLTSAAMGRKTNSAGAVMFKKPGRMRWDYEKPERAMYVSDGNTLWLYEPDDQQAFKQALSTSQLPAALAFLTGKGKLANEFDITLVDKSPYAAPGEYVLALSPKVAEPQVKSLLFIVDPKTFDVRESVITDGQGNLNDLTFADIRTNTHLPDSDFRWSPPSGVRVIDTAKLGR
jgi:outer membrane lipoprotein carrier protein